MAWFEEWFNQDYLAVYPYRTEAEAKIQVNFILQQLRKRSIHSVLDIGCGNARHLRQFARQGLSCFGIDLSTTLLNDAISKNKKEGLAINLAQADKRKLPFPNQCFDLITSLFTSFGYFKEDQDHIALLKEWRRVLLNNAPFFFDYMNKDYVIENLSPESLDSYQDYEVIQHRSLVENNSRINKTIEIRYCNNIPSKYFNESVRMYDLSDLNSIFSNSGFSIEQTFGDFEGASFTKSSKRLIILARAI